MNQSQISPPKGTPDAAAPIKEDRDARAPSAVWRRRTMLVIAGLLAGRLLYAAYVPLDLIADEAYYWDWSRQLDWCYYSKPPMVAWIIRLATEIGGPSAWVVRTPAVFLGTLGLWWIYLLAARMFDARTGFWSVVLCAATPGSVVLGLLMTIDAPFLFCWGLSMYCLWRMLERRPDRWFWIALTGLGAGLGLLSKESMLAFFMATWLFVALSRTDRREWRRPGCWAMTFLSLALLTPVLVWNAHHHWVTFQHSSTHFELQNDGLAMRLIRSAEFLGSQLGVISPITCLVFIVVATLVLRSWRQITRPALFLICFSVIPLACVVILSLTRRVQPNWPAPFYGAGLILTAAWLTGHVQPGVIRQSAPHRALTRSRLLASCVWCGILCAAATCLAPAVVLALGLDGSKLDPTFRLRGWNRFADRVADCCLSVPRPDRTFVLVATGRQEVSELAFYLPGQPRISLWNPGTTVASQYDLWPSARHTDGWDTLIVTGGQADVNPQLANQFHSLKRYERIRIPLGHGRCRDYALWLGRDYQPADAVATGHREVRR